MILVVSLYFPAQAQSASQSSEIGRDQIILIVEPNHYTMKAKKTTKKEINLASACNISRTPFILDSGKGAPSIFADPKTGKR